MPVLAALLAGTFVVGGCDRQTGGSAQPPAAGPQVETLDRSHKGEPIPDFTLADASGAKLALPALKGRPVLINLWATWCGPCVKELPTLDALANRADSTLQIVTVSQDMASPDKVQGFLDARGLARLPSWLDPENDLSFHYATGTLPTTVLYDGEGREVWRYVGGKEWNSPEALALLAEAQPRP